MCLNACQNHQAPNLGFAWVVCMSSYHLTFVTCWKILCDLANLIERHLESFTVPVWIAEISHVTAASNGAQRNVVGQLSNELSHTSFNGHILSGPWTRTYRAILLYTGMKSWESCKCYESSSTMIKHLTWENLGECLYAYICIYIHINYNYNISRSSGKV